MPKFKTEKFSARNSAGSHLDLTVAINISAEGEFYANLPAYLADAFVKQRDYSAKCLSADAPVRLVAKTYEALRSQIQEGLKRYLTPRVTEEPVIRYNIESHVSFALTPEGEIRPNAGYVGAEWVTDRGRYGDHHAAKPAPGGYSLTIGAKALLKRTIRHGDNVRIEYINYGGQGCDNPAKRLNDWCSMDLGDRAKEIPYSDKAAQFFYNLLFGMATLSRQVQQATFEQDTLLQLIEKKAGIGLLGAPAAE